MTKTAFVAVATIVLLACAGVAEAQGPNPTNVRVNEPIAKGGQPLIWIDQEPIIVRGKGVKIVWQIPSTVTGYQFAKNGIVFLKAPPGEFVCELGEKGQSFSCVDANSKPARYKYTINLLGIGKTSPKPLDPWVVNDM